MVNLDFSLSDGWSGEASTSLAAADELVLRYECFLGDVTFQVGECDLSAVWGWVPVLDFALSLDGIVDQLGEGPETELLFEFTESDAVMYFSVSDGMVEVRASYASCQARIYYVDLQREVKSFLSKVLGCIIDKYPDLLKNPVISDLREVLG